MSLWIDKYRPRNLDEISFLRAHADLLKKMSVSEGLPHLMFYGPNGAGKKTLIDALLNGLYGDGVDKMRASHAAIDVGNNKTIDVSFLSSNYHIEIYPSDVGVYDRHVIQELIKTTAQTKQIDFTAKKKYKVVVIQAADLMSHNAQAALRRTMERYASNMRIFLSCTSYSKIIAPIRSRCLQLRVPAPNPQTIFNALKLIPSEPSLNDEVLLAIANKTDGNARKALIMLQTAHSLNITSANNIDALTSDWERLVADICNIILSNQTPDQVLKCREILYRLLAHCIPPENILLSLCELLLEKTDTILKPSIVHAAANCNYMLTLGSKSIVHLEAFVTRIMSSYKAYLIDAMGP